MIRSGVEAEILRLVVQYLVTDSSNLLHLVVIILFQILGRLQIVGRKELQENKEAQEYSSK
jgi:hypothetical protein